MIIIFLTSLFNAVCCGLFIFLCTPFLAPSANPVARSSQQLTPSHIQSSQQQEACYLNLTGVSKNRGGIYPQIIHGFLLGFSILFTINHPFWGKLPHYFWKQPCRKIWICWLWAFPPSTGEAPCRGEELWPKCSPAPWDGSAMSSWVVGFVSGTPKDMGEIPPKNGKIAHTIPISTRFSLEPTFFFFYFFGAGFFFLRGGGLVWCAC